MSVIKTEYKNERIFFNKIKVSSLDELDEVDVMKRKNLKKLVFKSFIYLDYCKLK